MIINRARCTAECSARKKSVQPCLAYLQQLVYVQTHDVSFFCSQHQFLFNLLWIFNFGFPDHLILGVIFGEPDFYQPNQTWAPNMPLSSQNQGSLRTKGTQNWFTLACLYCHIVDAWRWPKDIEIRLKFFWGWSLSQTQVEHGMCVSLSQSCPFSPNVKRVSPEAASKVSTIVGIFHPCESSSSFYFHQMKMEYKRFTTFLKGFLGSRYIL